MHKAAFFMQDIGSMQVVELAGIKPGDAVIDVCAAPGGKACMHWLSCTEKAVCRRVT